MEEGVVLQGPDLVRGIDRLAATQAVAVHVVCLEHPAHRQQLFQGESLAHAALSLKALGAQPKLSLTAPGARQCRIRGHLVRSLSRV